MLTWDVVVSGWDVVVFVEVDAAGVVRLVVAEVVVFRSADERWVDQFEDCPF